MIKVKDIYNFIDSIAPYNTQAEFDNSGFTVGDMNAEVKTVLVSLDLTSEVLNEAEQIGAQLIVTHHPAIFDPLKSLESDSAVYKAAAKNISVISAHTNLDIAENGVNFALLNAIGIKNFTTSDNDPFLKFADMGKISSDELIKRISASLGATVRYNGVKKSILKLAVSSGAGGSSLDEAIKQGADAFLTGEAKYHNFVEADEKGILLMAAGHFETENVFVPVLGGMLKEKFPSLDVARSKRISPIKTYIYTE